MHCTYYVQGVVQGVVFDQQLFDYSHLIPQLLTNSYSTLLYLFSLHMQYRHNTLLHLPGTNMIVLYKPTLCAFRIKIFLYCKYIKY